MKYVSKYIAKIKKIIFYRKRFKEINKYLIGGTYYGYVNKGIILNKLDFEKSRSLNSFLNLKKNLFNVEGGIFLGKVSKTNIQNELNFYGTAALLSNKLPSEVQYGELKIFDLLNAKVLSFCNTKESFSKKINNTDVFSKFFLIPKITHTNKENLLIVEELIDYHKPSLDEYSIISNDLISNYTLYFKNAEKKEIEIEYKFCYDVNSLQKENKETVEFILSLIDFDKLPLQIPYYFQHGDLSLSNILVDKNRSVYIIDFEHASFFSFLYDVMWFWQNEALNNNNYTAIEQYFAGDYDRQLSKLFETVAIKFDTSLKVSYLLLVFIELIDKRIIKNKPLIKNNFLNHKVRQTIEKIVTINEKIKKIN